LGVTVTGIKVILMMGIWDCSLGCSVKKKKEKKTALGCSKKNREKKVALGCNEKMRKKKLHLIIQRKKT